MYVSRFYILWSHPQVHLPPTPRLRPPSKDASGCRRFFLLDVYRKQCYAKHTYVYTYIYIHMYIHLQLYIYLYIYIHLQLCMYIYIYDIQTSSRMYMTFHWEWSKHTCLSLSAGTPVTDCGSTCPWMSMLNNLALLTLWEASKVFIYFWNGNILLLLTPRTSQKSQGNIVS